jgi:hypothetical protein
VVSFHSCHYLSRSIVHVPYPGQRDSRPKASKGRAVLTWEVRICHCESSDVLFEESWMKKAYNLCLFLSNSEYLDNRLGVLFHRPVLHADGHPFEFAFQHEFRKRCFRGLLPHRCLMVRLQRSETLHWTGHFQQESSGRDDRGH